MLAMLGEDTLAELARHTTVHDCTAGEVLQVVHIHTFAFVIFF